MRTHEPIGVVVVVMVISYLFGVGVGYFIHDRPVTSIPRQEVYVLCQPTTNQWGQSDETSAQYEACVSVATQAWKMGQR